MKRINRIICVAFLLLPFVSLGQSTRLTEKQSKQCLERLAKLNRQYEAVLPLGEGDLVLVGKDIETDEDIQIINYGIVDGKGKEVVPIRYNDWYRVDGKYIAMLDYTPDNYIMYDIYDRQGHLVAHYQRVDEMGLYYGVRDIHISYLAVAKDSLWGVVDSNFNTVLPFRYKDARYLGYNYVRVEDADGKPSYIDLSGNVVVSGPYEELTPLTENIFSFWTGNPYAKGSIFGYVDLYGNTTASEAEMEQMRMWMKRDYQVEALRITNVVPHTEAEKSYATVHVCLNDSDTVGFLLISREDSASMALFSNCVSSDLWGKTVGISPKRYDAGLADIQLAEEILPEVMKTEVLPKMGRWKRYIGNPDNYTKYYRTYGFYYNEEGERCVYIQLDLDKYVGFSRMWDACDAVVYLNLNLDTRKVIRAYQSSCQSY